MNTVREPAPTNFAMPTDLEVVITRVFEAPRRIVFEAWTSPKHIPHWMVGPEGWSMPVCEVDLRPGGSWHFVWRKSNGTEMPMRGSYREVAPPDRLVWTECWGEPWPETINTLVLTERDGRTTAALTVRYPSKEARDAAMRTGVRDGSIQSYARLDRYLAGLAT